jgi:hypothetical protein
LQAVKANAAIKSVKNSFFIVLNVLI